MQRIVIPPSREEFEARVKTFCTKAWVKKIMWAWDKCGEVHDKRPPRDDKSLYRDHPRASTWILIIEVRIRNPRLILLELFHDTGEEEESIAYTYEDLERDFTDSFLTFGHKAITKLPGQHPRDYTMQVFAGGIKVVIVKFADRLHNLRTLNACKPDKQKRVIMDTLMYYNADNGEYREFLRGASKKDRDAIDLLWKLIMEEIEEWFKKNC